MIYTYTKTPLNIDRLTSEIQQSAIITALSSMTSLGVQVSLDFKAELSVGDKNILDSIIDAHTGEPLPSAEPSVKISSPVQVSTLPEAKPFASPDYRTKRDATPSLVTIPVGTSVSLDYVLPEERYVSGGTLIVKNAELGDYVSATIVDTLGIIPAPYRAAICENWPIVATYICNSWVEVENGPLTHHAIDTYPLNAKITQALTLRLTYNSTSEGESRVACVNYNLTKKLV